MFQQSAQRHKDLFITAVPRDLVDSIWPEVLPLISPVMRFANGTMDADDLKSFIGKGDMQLWVVIDKVTQKIPLVVVTEIVLYPKLKSCRIVLVNGDGLKNMRIAVDHVENWARSIDCKRIEGSGRQALGIGRILKASGFKHISTHIGKDL